MHSLFVLNSSDTLLFASLLSCIIVAIKSKSYNFIKCPITVNNKL